MTTTDAIIKLTEINNFEVKPGLVLKPGTVSRLTPEDNIYYFRSSLEPNKIYVCYDMAEPHDKSIDCLAKHFPTSYGHKSLQPFAAKDYSKI